MLFGNHPECGKFIFQKKINTASISTYIVNIGTNWFEWPYKWGKIIKD